MTRRTLRPLLLSAALLVLLAAIALAKKRDPVNPAVTRVLAALDSTVFIESFLLSGPEQVIDDSIPNIGQFPIVAHGPEVDPHVAQWLTPLVVRMAKGDCGEQTACETDPLFGLRFHGGSEPLDLLVDFHCQSTIGFRTGSWAASYPEADSDGKPIRGKDGRYISGLSPHAECVRDSMESLFVRVFPGVALPE